MQWQWVGGDFLQSQQRVLESLGLSSAGWGGGGFGLHWGDCSGVWRYSCFFRGTIKIETNRFFITHTLSLRQSSEEHY